MRTRPVRARSRVRALIPREHVRTRTVTRARAAQRGVTEKPSAQLLLRPSPKKSEPSLAGAAKSRAQARGKGQARGARTQSCHPSESVVWKLGAVGLKKLPRLHGRGRTTHKRRHDGIARNRLAAPLSTVKLGQLDRAA